MSSLFPPIVMALTHGHDAWIVGSAADPQTKLHRVRDLDVLVPFSEWNKASFLLHGANMIGINSFGGFKFEEVKDEESFTVDVWPGELGAVMQNDRATWAWHPRSGRRIKCW